MAAVTFDIVFGKDEQAQRRTIVIDPDDLSLGFNDDLEVAMETNKWRDLIKVFAELLGLTYEEARQITNRQFKDMMSAIRGAVNEAVASPNGSTPTSS